jgi:hypothetical protein
MIAASVDGDENEDMIELSRSSLELNKRKVFVCVL